MTEHDPFCGASNGAEAYYQCSCDLIRRVRADEREQKMAAADLSFLDAIQTREEMADLRAQVAALLLPTLLLASDVNENRARKAGARQALEIIDAVIEGDAQ